MKAERRQELLTSTGLTDGQLDELISTPYTRRVFGDTPYFYYKDEECIFEFEGEHEITLEGVTFKSLKEVLSIYKNDQEYTLNSAIKEFSDVFEDEENAVKYGAFVFSDREVEDVWNVVEPMTAKEALSYENMEQRMVALRYIGAQGLITELNADLLDEQTITKKQEQTVYLGEGRPSPEDRDPKNFKKVQKEYDDTYKLYRIKTEEITKGGNVRGQIEQEFIYICGMKDASTDREYYIFVEPEVGQQKDAINAIASTLRIVDGEGQLSSPLSKEDYFTLRSET